MIIEYIGTLVFLSIIAAIYHHHRIDRLERSIQDYKIDVERLERRNQELHDKIRKEYVSRVDHEKTVKWLDDARTAISELEHEKKKPVGVLNRVWILQLEKY